MNSFTARAGWPVSRPQHRSRLPDKLDAHGPRATVRLVNFLYRLHRLNALQACDREA